MVENKDVPLEAAVKYLVKERDLYKRKLNYIVPYTKYLEAELRDIDKGKKKEENKELATALRRVDVLEAEKKRLIEENTALIKDYRKSEWFIQLKKRYDKYKSERDAIRQRLNEAYCRLLEYENKDTER